MDPVSFENLFFLPLSPSANSLTLSLRVVNNAPADYESHSTESQMDLAKTIGYSATKKDFPGSRLPSLFVGDESNDALRILFDFDQLPSHYWPMVLAGPSGSGKTALAQTFIERAARLAKPLDAIATETKSSSETSSSLSKKSFLITANDFARGLNESIQTKSAAQFIDRILSFAAVGFDNIEDLAHFPLVQPDFVCLLDQLCAKGTPVVITTRMSPDCRIEGLSSQLTSRLNFGLAIPVALPGFEARCHLLQALAEKHLVPLSVEQIRSLAKQFPLSLPRLNNIILEAKQHWMLSRCPVTNIVDAKSLKKISGGRAPVAEQLNLLVRIVADHYQLAPSVLRGTSRKQTIMLARSICIFLARNQLKLSYSVIGNYFSGRDHSTTIHAFKKIVEQMNSNSDVRFLVQQLELRLLELTSLQSGAIG